MAKSPKFGKATKAEAYLKAYMQAQKADAAFSDALRKQFGNFIGDVRYQTDKHPANIKKLGKAKHQADEKVRKALEAMRAAGESVNPASKITTARVPARIKVGRSIVPGFVRKNPKTGKVQVFVTPATLKKNPGLRRRVKSNPEQKWTMAAIRAANRDSGHLFFSRNNMKFSNSKVLPTVYQGPGGVFFVTSETRELDIPRTYSVRQFNPLNGRIRTETTYNDKWSAIDHAKRSAGKA